MAATIRRLRTRDQRLKRDAASRLATLVEEYELLARELGREVPEGVRRDRAELVREALALAGWPYVMISPKQFNAVRRWLRMHSVASTLAVDLWCEIFEHLDPRTGEVLASRSELAELVGTQPRKVSRIMGELARVGAIQRHRDPANGPVRYFINPRVGTCLPETPRKLAQAAAPPLRLVEPA